MKISKVDVLFQRPKIESFFYNRLILRLCWAFWIAQFRSTSMRKSKWSALKKMCTPFVRNRLGELDETFIIFINRCRLLVNIVTCRQFSKRTSGHVLIFLNGASELPLSQLIVLLFFPGNLICCVLLTKKILRSLKRGQSREKLHGETGLLCWLEEICKVNTVSFSDFIVRKYTFSFLDRFSRCLTLQV